MIGSISPFAMDCTGFFGMIFNQSIHQTGGFTVVEDTVPF